MGDVLRRYWTPALLSSERPELQENCPHRGASLYCGRNEDRGLIQRPPSAGG